MGRALRPEDCTEIAVTLIAEEIEATVADSIGRGGILDVGYHAERLARTYPPAGLSEKEIANRMVLAAVNAGIGSMEIGHNDAAADRRSAE